MTEIEPWFAFQLAFAVGAGLSLGACVPFAVLIWVRSWLL